MKKYIAPELEVELYALDTSIAAGCVINSKGNGYAVASIDGGNDSVFAANGSQATLASGDDVPPEYYTTPNFGNPGVSQASGSCDCYYSAYGVMALATS